MSVVAISMFRNEEDVAPYVVRHMLAECDSVIVADNCSTDGTRELLEAIGDPRLTIVDEPRFAYRQAETMNRLAAMVPDAEWIVPFDADEWWFGHGRIADVLCGLPVDVTATRTVDMIPQPSDNGEADPFQRIVWWRPNSFWASTPKVAFRPRPGRLLMMGNHGLEAEPWPTVGPLRIRHYPFRSLEQARLKLRHGRRAIRAARTPRDLGVHWQQWGAYSDGKLARWWSEWTDPAGLVRWPGPRAIIAANGSRRRWGNHLGVAKQELVIDGETLLGRTVRLLRENGVEDIVITGPFPGYGVPSVAPRGNTEVVDGRLAMRDLWSATERTIVLLGDVFYSDEAMRTIVGHTERDAHLFARFGRGTQTGKGRPEIFANSFWPEHREAHEASLRRVAWLRKTGATPQAGLWESYLLDHGHPIGGRSRATWTDRTYIAEDGSVPNCGDATEIDDWTEDFDYPADYDAFMARRS